MTLSLAHRRLPLLAVATLTLLAAVPIRGQPISSAGLIALYSDSLYTGATLPDAAPDTHTVYLVHRVPAGATGSRFRLAMDGGVNLTPLTITVHVPGSTGDLSTGIQLDYGGCVFGDVLLATITYAGNGSSDPCSRLRIVPDPAEPSGQIVSLNCAATPLAAESATLAVNPGLCCPRTRHVPIEYATIQEAITATAERDTVLLAAGTYSGPGNENVDIKGRSLVLTSRAGPDSAVINVIGGYPFYAIVLTYDLDVHISNIGVVAGTVSCWGYIGSTTSVRLSGVVIKGYQDTENFYPGVELVRCAAIVEDCHISGFVAHEGGGIYAYGSSVTIRGCHIERNVVTGSGGGIALDGCDFNVVGNLVEHNYIIQGGAGAGIFTGSLWTWPPYSHGTIHDNTISYNDANAHLGGGVYAIADSVTDNLIIGNNTSCPLDLEGPSLGGGLAGVVSYVAWNTFESNTVRYRSAGTFGGAIYGEVGLMEDNLFLDNGVDPYGGTGGPSTIDGTVDMMRGNTFIFRDGRSKSHLAVEGTLENNIFYNLDPVPVFAPSANPPTVACSGIYSPNYGPEANYIDGGGNVFADPLFCDIDGGDYHLRSNSPCLFNPCGRIGLLGLGCWGDEPAIASVSDITGDQGGFVRVSWLRSRYDAPADGVDITGYSLFRRQDAHAAAGKSGPITYQAAASRAPTLAGWDYLTTVPARGDSAYQFVASTLCDSSASGICWSVFMVSAMTPDPLTYYDSAPDSGYSANNDPWATSVQDHPTPTALRLHNPSPNPFNPSTTIRFELPSEAPVEIMIYDVQGRRVRTLAVEDYPPGIHEVRWDGLDDKGAQVSSGVYYCRLRVGGDTRSRAMVLIK